MKKLNQFLCVTLSLILLVGCLSVGFTANALTAPKLNSVKMSNIGVLLDWEQVDNAEGYYIYRKTAKTKFALIGKSDINSYIDMKAKSNTKYYYAVKSFDGKSKSKYSNTKNVLCVGIPKVTVKNVASGIKVSWKKVKGATGYRVAMKKTTGKKYKTAYKGKALSFVDDNVDKGATYSIKVKAITNKTSGSYSEPVTKMFLEQPNLHAEEYLDMDGITLEWKKVKGAQGYRIYRSLKKENNFKHIKTITDGKTEIYVDSTCVSINSYKYYIVAYNGADKSAKSNVDSDVFGYFEDEDTPLYLTISKGEVYKDIYKKICEYSAETLISWKSSDSKTVAVSDVGVITGVKRGKATLTAKGTYNGKVRHVYIIVTVE
ncbi:MAG: hypothetical protein ACI4Q8_00165 [Ruminococcus sp.]